jgi:hypothetical protein
MENDMAPSNKTAWHLGAILLGLALVVGSACESSDKYAGTYSAQGKTGEVRMELKANGQGIWIAANQEVPFSWHIKGGDLRINTKEGGVIVGKIEGNAIKINLPGQKELLFKRAAP